MTREEIIIGLGKIGDFFRARADMAMGDGKMMLLNWMKCAEEAAEAMKSQEARLLTFDDLLTISGTDCIVYVERRTKTYYNEMAFVHVEKVYRDSVVFHGQKDIFGHNRKDYGKTWRCWTARPTEEQMYEEAWPIMK